MQYPTRPNSFVVSGTEIIDNIPREPVALKGRSLPFGNVRGDVLSIGKTVSSHRMENRLLDAVHRPTWGSFMNEGIFCIPVAELDFGDGPILEGLHLRAGPERGTEPPFWCMRAETGEITGADRTSLDRVVIWSLKPGSRPLILVDQFGGVRKLEFCLGKWELLEVDLFELADYISWRGLMASVRNKKPAAWAWHNLCRIREALPDNEEIAEATNLVEAHMKSFA